MDFKIFSGTLDLYDRHEEKQSRSSYKDLRAEKFSKEVPEGIFEIK